MRWLLKSLALFACGYALGLVLFALLSAALPQLRQMLLELLVSKAEAQEAIVGSAGYAILLNNLLASLLASYGGVLTTLAFARLDAAPDPRLGALRRLDGRLRNAGEEALKFYLSLFLIPAGVLLLNGAVLGFLLGFYLSSPGEYLARLLPHAIFELPAILLSAGIGIKIGDALLPELGTRLQAELLRQARRTLPLYLLVVLLLCVGAYLEA
ncbi:MAG: stage II sporulation protein M [Euryarchaeota archaeon]|nr:stage II sporulation protein M [Euryarchaeota archaeon]